MLFHMEGLLGSLEDVSALMMRFSTLLFFPLSLALPLLQLTELSTVSSLIHALLLTSQLFLAKSRIWFPLSIGPHQLHIQWIIPFISVIFHKIQSPFSSSLSAFQKDHSLILLSPTQTPLLTALSHATGGNYTSAHSSLFFPIILGPNQFLCIAIHVYFF